MGEVAHVDARALLRSHGLVLTAQRLAVLSAVIDAPHSTATDIADAVRSQIGTISRQAVYDALGAFTDHGVLRRIQPAGSPPRYEARVGDDHHHLICRTCNRVVDVEVDCAAGAVPCVAPAHDLGYEIDEAEIIFWGRCPACRAADRSSAALSRQQPQQHQPPTRSTQPDQQQSDQQQGART